MNFGMRILRVLLGLRVEGWPHTTRVDARPLLARSHLQNKTYENDKESIESLYHFHRNGFTGDYHPHLFPRLAGQFPKRK